jgi:hypothetical protein
VKAKREFDATASEPRMLAEADIQLKSGRKQGCRNRVLKAKKLPSIKVVRSQAETTSFWGGGRSILA